MFLRLISFAAASALAAPAAAAARPWLDREFSQPGSPPLADVERMLNEECRPSGLDGIQMYAIQKGHEDALHLHVSCRQDGARARYRVEMPTAKRGGMGAVIAGVVANPRVRIGPFHFGEAGGDDGIVLITRLR